MAADTPSEVEDLWRRFHEVVNMTSRELVEWLGVQVDLDGPTPGPSGRAPLGEAVLAILRKRRTDLSDDDRAAMRKVVDVVESETGASTREEIVGDERKRHRLMAVGHDPLREQ